VSHGTVYEAVTRPFLVGFELTHDSGH